MIIPNRKENIVADKPSPCSVCEDRYRCVSLCERVELWANQDYVGKNSNLLLQNRGLTTRSRHAYGGNDSWLDLVSATNPGAPDSIDRDSSSSVSAWDSLLSMRLSEKVMRFVYSYYMLGKRIRDIAIDEETTSQTVDQRHIHAKKSILDRLTKMSRWNKTRGDVDYESIAQYDTCAMFYGHSYPRRVIAKLLGVHSSVIIRRIRKGLI